MSEINLTLPNANPAPPASAPVSAAPEAALLLPSDPATEPSAQVQALMSQIDLHDSTTSICYGKLVQAKLKQLTDQSLRATARCDSDRIGTLLTRVSTLVEDFNEASLKKTLRPAKQRATLETQYAQVSKSLEQIEKELEGQRLTLTVDIKLLSETYQQLVDLCDELTAHIEAGRGKLAAVRQGELTELRHQADSGNEQSVLLHNRLVERCDNFELRLQDLELTQTIALQSIAQVQLAEQTNTKLAQKIQSSINNAIPLWQQSIAVALTVQHYREKLRGDNAKLLNVINDTISAYQKCREQVIRSES